MVSLGLPTPVAKRRFSAAGDNALLPTGKLCYEGRTMMPAATSPFPFRLAATDLDGTLLGPHKEIGAENLAALRELEQRGARVALASGRRHENSVRFYRQLALTGPLISCAGALIKDPDTGEILRERLLSAQDAASLVTEGLRRGYTVIYYHREHLYCSERSRWTELYESRVDEPTELFPGSLDDLNGENALKIVWYGEPENIRAGRAELEARYRSSVVVVATDPENLEFLDLAANKADALTALAKFYGVDPAATLALGDGENDAPMLRSAGLGVAVNGAGKTARDAAKFTGPDGPPETRFARAVEAVFQRLAANPA